MEVQTLALPQSLYVVVSHKLELCFPLQHLHCALDQHSVTQWQSKVQIVFMNNSILLLGLVTVLQANDK